MYVVLGPHLIIVVTTMIRGKTTALSVSAAESSCDHGKGNMPYLLVECLAAMAEQVDRSISVLSSLKKTRFVARSKLSTILEMT